MARQSTRPPGWPSQKERIERSSGYNAITGRPEIRRHIALLILLEAKPELIAYTFVADRIQEEYGIKCQTAYKHILGGHKSTAAFVFDNLISTDDVYLQFISHKGFRETYLRTLKVRNAYPQEYGEEYPKKVLRVVDDIKALYNGFDALYFTKYFLADRASHAAILSRVRKA